MVSMCLVEDLKVYSSQLITCYWDRVQHVTLARTLQQEKKKIKTAGEPSIGRRRRAPKKSDWISEGLPHASEPRRFLI